ncbi:large ribosomal subunit protein bL35 [Solicola gregarius]|uniref:Large ribosomal subunit protein bL35 n=1 Tax=Solicola gregarius TaxID=2908642 RepID=A0AA46YK82_9ACTN|nr:50S ribosomal protein L35 [Solicola gregarius]UYM05217.1 50S ribosomal protein L35 [Solicola gregarius]
MPKMKPNSGIKKRVKVTGTGKLMHAHGRRRTHLQQKSGSGAARREDANQPISKADAPRVKKLLGK